MKNILASFLLIAFTSNANAVFVDNGNYTTDTVSGLDWLDLTETIGKSYNTVSSQFGIGDLYDGWQYANRQQFNILVSNWSGKPVASLGSSTNYTEGSDSIDGLVQLLGNTYFPNTTNSPLENNYSFGTIADQNPLNSSLRFTAMIYDYAEFYQNISDYSLAYNGSMDRYTSKENIGAYLVRQTSWSAPPAPSVPEASSLYLLAFGLLGLLGAARRKV